MKEDCGSYSDNSSLFRNSNISKRNCTLNCYIVKQVDVLSRSVSFFVFSSLYRPEIVSRLTTMFHASTLLRRLHIYLIVQYSEDKYYFNYTIGKIGWQSFKLQSVKLQNETFIKRLAQVVKYRRLLFPWHFPTLVNTSVD